MNHIKKLSLLLLFVSIFCGCKNNSKTDKHQGKRNNIINVHDKVKEIKMEEVLIGLVSYIYLFNNYLIIRDYQSHGKLVHLFDKNTFKHVTSIINKGQGPGEMANIGHIAADEPNRRFFVTDNATYKIFTYYLDSILVNSEYMPEVKIKINENLHIKEYHYINDTLCIGKIVERLENSQYGANLSMGKWNMATGELKPMKYENPDIKIRRISFDVSMEKGIYVECYRHNDLMTICSIDGGLIYNIYGPNYSNETANRMTYYGMSVKIIGDRIFALYSGKNTFVEEDGKAIDVIYSTKFQIFNLEGDYLQTLETNYQITEFCYDKENNRLIMYMNEEFQFAYLDLDGII